MEMRSSEDEWIAMGRTAILSDGEGFISRFAIWIEMEILSPSQLEDVTPGERWRERRFCQWQS